MPVRVIVTTLLRDPFTALPLLRILLRGDFPHKEPGWMNETGAEMVFRAWLRPGATEY
jgi:hypothetical protein